jgi:hypothetical protein
MIEQIAIRGPFAGSTKTNGRGAITNTQLSLRCTSSAPGHGFDAMGMISIPREFRRLGRRRGAPRKIEFSEWMIRLRGRGARGLARNLRLPIDGRRNGVVLGRRGILLAAGVRSSDFRFEGFEAFELPFSGSSREERVAARAGARGARDSVRPRTSRAGVPWLRSSQKITACSARTTAPINTY